MAVIAIVVVAILLVALLVVVRRSTGAKPPGSGDGADPYRSHAEASRDREEEGS